MSLVKTLITRKQILSTTSSWEVVSDSPLIMKRYLFTGPEMSPHVVARVEKLRWPYGPDKRKKTTHPELKGLIRFSNSNSETIVFDPPFSNNNYMIGLDKPVNNHDLKIPSLKQELRANGFTLSLHGNETFTGVITWEIFNRSIPVPAKESGYEPENWTYEVTAGLYGQYKYRVRAKNEPDTLHNGFPTARKAMHLADEFLLSKGYILPSGVPVPETFEEADQRVRSGERSAWPKWKVK